MSNLSIDNNSSSEDEGTQDNFRSNLSIPNINLSNIRKQQTKASPKNNIVKAGKRLKSNKSVRFPDLYQSRDTIISNDSTTNNSSDLESLSEVALGDDHQCDPNLPTFNINVQNQPLNVFDDSNVMHDNDSDDDQNELNNQVAELPPTQDFDTSSSDDDDDDSDCDENEQHPGDDDNRIKSQNTYLNRHDSTTAESQYIKSKTSPPNDIESGTSGAELSRKESKKPHFLKFLHGETDITEQDRNGSLSGASNKSDESDKTKSNFKDILRKIALTDQAYSDPQYAHEAEGQSSHSDSFLGRVLSMSRGGLNSGGLAPGASRSDRERPLDEEELVGGNTADNEDDNAIEMKKLDFDNINDEAKNLIMSHVPEAAMQLRRDEHHTSRDDSAPTSPSSTTFLVNKEREKSEGHTPLDSYAPSEAEQSDDETFYQPNSNFNMNSEFRDSFGDNNLMLDDGAENGYVSPPKKVQAGVLSSLLKLYQNPQENKSSASSISSAGGPSNLADEIDFEPDSADLSESRNTSILDFSKMKEGLKKGGRKAKKFPTHLSTNHKKNHSRSSTGTDDELDEKYDGQNNDDDLDYLAEGQLPSFQNAKPKSHKKTNSGGTKVPHLGKRLKKHKKQNAQRLKITVHIADILQRQRFIMRMCRALMLYGAPTHRLEEYLTMTSRVLEIDGQYMYFPGCMIIAFGDAATRTSEVHLVKCSQGLNLAKLSDTHAIYKGVIHDLMGVEEAASKLEELLRKKNLYSPWVCVLLYGLGSASVCPFAFSGDWLDVPIAFGLGLCVGYLQYFISSISNLYSSVFEVTASIVVSFIARAIGSINGGNTFCFGAIAQGSLALILPGYIILCGSLELQSKNLVAGSVRMFYAIIYSLFLGFGITLGAALYGWVDKDSTNKAQCDATHKVDDKWRILFIPLFSLCLGLINQARWRQLPVMVFISCVGYIGNYFAGKHFQEVTEFTAAIGAFIIGILGNMYSRIWKGMAVSAMLPAIFVQVPSGIASKSTLLSGINSANQITDASGSSTSSTSDTSSLSFGATMVEVSIGISVGLFAAALVVYPFGKKRTGLFTL